MICKKDNVILCGFGLTASKNESIFESYNVIAYAFSELSNQKYNFLKKDIPVIKISDISKFDYDYIIICSSLQSSSSLRDLLVKSYVSKKHIRFLINKSIVPYNLWLTNKIVHSLITKINNIHNKLSSIIISCLVFFKLGSLIKKEFICKDSIFKCTDKICGITIRKYTSNLRNQMMYQHYLKKNSLIKKDYRILVIAPHPDDESIGCGGVISKYSSQCDVLCVNSSGVKYDWNTETAEEIAEIRCNEFLTLMKKEKISNYHINKIYGNPPFFNEILNSIEIIKSKFSFETYDVIFTPYIYDGHREHQFVSDYLLKKILSSTKCKQSLLIAEYEVWSPIKDVNYYEDISDFINAKKEMIQHYCSRKNNRYFECISSLNSYRGLLGQCMFAEAFKVTPVNNFLNQEPNFDYFK